MIKSELIQIITARNPHLYHRNVEMVVDAVLDEVARAMEEGGRVEIRGFGTFSVRHRSQRSGRNPSNGTSIFVDEKWVPFFRTGRGLQRRMNPADKEVPREPAGKKAVLSQPDDVSRVARSTSFPLLNPAYDRALDCKGMAMLLGTGNQ